MNKHIVISALEISGDEYTSWLIKSLFALDPTFKFSGIAGDCAKKAGMNLIAHFNNGPSMALFDIIRQVRYYRALQQQLLLHLKHTQPSLLILVDSGAFNLKLAKVAKKMGIPVVYFIPPKAWAWGQWRLKALRKHCDLLACLYAFETEFFIRHGCNAVTVSHPRQLKRSVKTNHDHPIIAICPGSRKNEIRFGLPTLLAAAKRLKVAHPNISLELIVAHKRLLPQINTILVAEAMTSEIKCITDHAKAHLARAHIALATSGTLTFELAMLHIPMVIVYKMSDFNYFLASYFVNTNWAGLPNLLAQRTIIPELIQDKMSVNNIVNQTTKLLDEPNQYQRMVRQLQSISACINAPHHQSIGQIIYGFVQKN